MFTFRWKKLTRQNIPCIMYIKDNDSNPNITVVMVQYTHFFVFIKRLNNFFGKTNVALPFWTRRSSVTTLLHLKHT